MHTRLIFGGSLLLTILGAGLSARAQQRRTTLLPSSNEDPSYRKEFVYGVNFNTRGGLIGGVSVRSMKPLNQDWSRFWSVEGVEVKHPKEYKLPTPFGGLYVDGKANYMFVVRPSVGLQRVIFRKAPESGVQVNALVGAGPSVALLMPYYITYDYTLRDSRNNPIGATDYRNEQYDPQIHTQQRIVDRAPLFSGIGETTPTIGAHVRGALSFEYGRYRDAVAGVETGFLFEAYTKRLTILRALGMPDDKLNTLFYPSVYLTIYLGHRS
ncbi:hypothetical protein HMJ29_05630 [Hymenobacter taeanensis]|uniref:Outer membrane beta-barrel protein n=1 Tax=Hymenobacter taeanensis TaxID=2735321 RepID=A0A6M6BGR3_9BACT|nr:MULTISPECIES: hypothetical protein [Hymenobacter]QJX46443.1 hypothetical protein HMJ29_05630 [Hymenobacter taeanensis]UOQ80306.1 hypothetical protein MUN83_15945 [Hymenobacter sp. 5414T-23]